MGSVVFDGARDGRWIVDVVGQNPIRAMQTAHGPCVDGAMLPGGCERATSTGSRSSPTGGSSKRFPSANAFATISSRTREVSRHGIDVSPTCLGADRDKESFGT